MRIAAAGKILALALTTALAPPAIAQQSPVVTLAEYPTGTFLENLDVLSDGRIVFTSYFAKTIEVLERGKARTFAKLSAHPVSILAIGDGFLVAAHGQPFVSGPAFVETQQFLLLDKTGRETGSFKAPEARFLNGMVRHTGVAVLVADSISGAIWSVDPLKKSMAVWLKDEALAPDPAVKEFRPGANGLKRQGRRLVISNSSRGTLSTVAVAASGAPRSPVTLLAKTGPIDDFVIDATGAIVFTTHGPSLMRRAADGAISTLIQTSCDGCTAVALLKGRRGSSSLIVLTTGGLSEGRKEPARVLSLPYRVPST